MDEEENNGKEILVYDSFNLGNGFVHTQYDFLFIFFPQEKGGGDIPMCQKYVAAKCQILQHSALIKLLV